MATILGKRKRRTVETVKDNGGKGSEDFVSLEVDAQELFRRHFEAKFKPLPVARNVEKVVREKPENVSEEESDWDGISDDGEGSVEVVEHTDAQKRMSLMSKEELKVFMSSRPPSSTEIVPLISNQAGPTPDEDDASEAANLKKDLELQRFLQESHLLESSINHSFSGKNRHKATDLRLQALGSKASILKQEKMPVSHRRGIIAKQSAKEEKRRREAKENGIILEKAQIGAKKNVKRDRGVGAPGVGRFSGGTLKLSRKDIFDIEGPRKSAAPRRGGRGRGKRGR